ncbi:M28 family metallopeptidase [Clostridium polynesiense]|uniref:M28 family metallopeptidase n=1 Tax=Clostridium polynesiense TaxID=1325933 RepID=UPI000693E62C|nr:M28 family metallopeptidase [Clostridium polynesiense]
MKILIKYLLTCLILSFNLFFIFLNKINAFNVNNVINDIEFLPSDNFKGRLTGSIENKASGEFIKHSFIKSNLLPYKGSYYESFKIEYPEMINKTPFLEVEGRDKNHIKSYVYGVDYKEDFINFRENYINFSWKDIKLSDGAIIAEKDNKKVIFFLSKENTFNFRSSFIKEAFYDMYIMINKNTYNDILKELRKGNMVKCSIPYIIKSGEADNITAVHQGLEAGNPILVISAHYDHIGFDFLGNVYNGALDNASGTAFILELSRYMKNLGPSDRDILFAAFNGEEFGCLGSKNFVYANLNSLKNSSLYNFDMIGSNKSLPLSIIGGKNDNESTYLIHSLSTAFVRRNISYSSAYEDSSDHMFFRKSNIEAVTLCQEDLERIHTPSDKIEFISPKAVKSAFKAFSKELIRRAYKQNIFIYYNNVGLILTLLLSLFISYYHINNN